MSDIRRTHPGYFSVTLGLALPWYLGLGIGFTFLKTITPGSYQVITAYVPLSVWGAIYLALGTVLLVTLLIPRVPHIIVRLCCGFGLMLTSFWLVGWVITLAEGKLQLIAAIPAWLTVALVEWAAFREPVHGPR